METKTKNYAGRVDLFRSVGCIVEGSGTISVIKEDHVCIVHVDVLGDTIHHLRVKVKNCFKGKGDKVKFRAKVALYADNTKVGLSDFSFI